MAIEKKKNQDLIPGVHAIFNVHELTWIAVLACWHLYLRPPLEGGQKADRQKCSTTLEDISKQEKS